jgi:hypothetical protein
LTDGQMKRASAFNLYAACRCDLTLREVLGRRVSWPSRPNGVPEDFGEDYLAVLADQLREAWAAAPPEDLSTFAPEELAQLDAIPPGTADPNDLDAPAWARVGRSDDIEASIQYIDDQARADAAAVVAAARRQLLPRGHQMTLTTEDTFDVLAEATGKFVREEIAAAKAELRAELTAEQRAAGEPLRYRGVWQRASPYQRGAAVTDNGSLWCCTSDGTTDRPGSSSNWQLMAKGGDR